jgi:hypothetical protein
MYKSLLWKEYRETRLSLAIITFSCVIISWINILLNNVGDSYVAFRAPAAGIWALNALEFPLYLFIVLLTVIYTIMAGAEAFSSEFQAKTFDFLVSRAVSRKVLWFCKLGFRISTLLFPITIYFFISEFLIGPDPINLMHRYIFAASALYVFSTSFFFSTIFNRPVKAGATGLIVYLGYTLLFFRFSENHPVFIITCLILAILFLIASFFIFTKGHF